LAIGIVDEVVQKGPNLEPVVALGCALASYVDILDLEDFGDGSCFQTWVEHLICLMNGHKINPFGCSFEVLRDLL